MIVVVNSGVIRQAMAKKGFLQKDLAEKVGVTYGALSQVFQRDKLPGLSTSFRMARLLDLDINDMFTLVDVPDSGADDAGGGGEESKGDKDGESE
jgi:DNA-binding XRE family transcriptional regulator